MASSQENKFLLPRKRNHSSLDSSIENVSSWPPLKRKYPNLTSSKKKVSLHCPFKRESTLTWPTQKEKVSLLGLLWRESIPTWPPRKRKCPFIAPSKGKVLLHDLLKKKKSPYLASSEEKVSQLNSSKEAVSLQRRFERENMLTWPLRTPASRRTLGKLWRAWHVAASPWRCPGRKSRKINQTAIWTMSWRKLRIFFNKNIASHSFKRNNWTKRKRSHLDQGISKFVVMNLWYSIRR